MDERRANLNKNGDQRARRLLDSERLVYGKIRESDESRTRTFLVNSIVFDYLSKKEKKKNGTTMQKYACNR